MQHSVGHVAGGSVAREAVLCIDANGRIETRSQSRSPVLCSPSLWEGRVTGNDSGKKESVCVFTNIYSLLRLTPHVVTFV